jgi:hypothetical protein
VRGYVTAYDAETGAQAWRWFVVTGDSGKPFEDDSMAAAAKTWDPAGKWWINGGGGTVWDSHRGSPAADPVGTVPFSRCRYRRIDSLHFFAFSPRSTRERMAPDSDGWSFRSAGFSIGSCISSCIRTPIIGDFPVATGLDSC